MIFSPPAESVASPAKGRTRTTQSPTKKEATVDKKEKVVDSTPRKSSRQKASNKPDAENDTHNKSTSPNKKVDPSTKRAEPVTATRSSRSTNADSVKKTPAKNNEPTKSSKSSQYKSTKPVNPIDLIDELQGIEDFLRESTNEQKTPEKTENTKKVEPSSESKATKLSKGKSAVDTPGKKGLETNSSVKSTSKSNDASSTSETKKLPVSEDKLGDEVDIESNSDTGTKRKAEPLSEQPSKLAKTEQRNEKQSAVVDKNKNVSNIENSNEPVKVFVAPELEPTDESNLTEGKCGNCVNCKRKPCYECSSCKREEFGNCIDMYCLNQRDHRDQRQAMRELYLQARQQNARPVEKRRLEESEDGRTMDVENSTKTSEIITQKKDSSTETEILESIKSKKTEGGNVKARFSDQGVIFEIETTESESEDEDLTIEQKIDKVMARITKNDKISPEKLQTIKSKVSKTITEKYSADKKEAQNKERKKNRTDYVYGGSSKAKKVRRCGECEGCTRDDCGKCIGCLDKPKFGGKNTRKQACTMRKCRMK